MRSLVFLTLAASLASCNSPGKSYELWQTDTSEARTLVDTSRSARVARKFIPSYGVDSVVPLYDSNKDTLFASFPHSTFSSAPDFLDYTVLRSGLEVSLHLSFKEVVGEVVSRSVYDSSLPPLSAP